jgi:hypothetical protein
MLTGCRIPRRRTLRTLARRDLCFEWEFYIWRDGSLVVQFWRERHFFDVAEYRVIPHVVYAHNKRCRVQVCLRSINEEW